MRWTLIWAILALLVPTVHSPAQEEEQEPEASDFVIGLSALNQQVVNGLEQLPTRRVMVLPFADMRGRRNRLTHYITEQLITAIAATRKYQLLDDAPLAELVEREGLSPLEMSTSPAYMQVAPQLANTSVVIGTVTLLQTRVGVMARILQGESSQIVGGAQVYLKSAGEVSTLLAGELTGLETEPTEEAPITGREQPTPERDESALPVTAATKEKQVAEAETSREAEAGKRISLEGRSENSLYSEGRERYESRQYDDAIRIFEHLVRTYPDSPLADNALYWTGECHYSKKNWQEALRQFNRLLNAYPFGNKVPAAMLKISYTQEKLGQLTDAIATLEQLIKRFPESEEAETGRQRLQLIRARQQG